MDTRKDKIKQDVLDILLEQLTFSLKSTQVKLQQNKRTIKDYAERQKALKEDLACYHQLVYDLKMMMVKK